MFMGPMVGTRTLNGGTATLSIALRQRQDQQQDTRLTCFFAYPSLTTVRSANLMND